MACSPTFLRRRFRASRHLLPHSGTRLPCVSPVGSYTPTFLPHHTRAGLQPDFLVLSPIANEGTSPWFKSHSSFRSPYPEMVLLISVGYSKPTLPINSLFSEGHLHCWTATTGHIKDNLTMPKATQLPVCHTYPQYSKALGDGQGTPL